VLQRKENVQEAKYGLHLPDFHDISLTLDHHIGHTKLVRRFWPVGRIGW